MYKFYLNEEFITRGRNCCHLQKALSEFNFANLNRKNVVIQPSKGTDNPIICVIFNEQNKCYFYEKSHKLREALTEIPLCCPVILSLKQR